MAIGDRAMRDQSSPQPPQQRNPTPRTMPGFNTMAAPSPYGAVSDEARRRYEERYNKKKAQEAEKAAQEARDQASALQAQQGGSGFRGPSPSAGYRGPSPQGQGQMGPPQQWQQQQQRPQQPPQQQAPPQQQYRSPPVQHQPPPQQYQQQQQQQPPPRPPQLQQQQSYQQVPGGYPQGQGQQQNRLSGQSYQSPTVPQQQQQQQQQPQQRWSNQPQSPSLSFSQKAVPPPDQSWNRPTQTPPQAEQPEDHELRTLYVGLLAYSVAVVGIEADDRFGQFDSSRTGQLNSYDLQRLLAKDATMEAREDCVKMVRSSSFFSRDVGKS
jgi:hypothetical protein